MNVLFFCNSFWPEGSGGELATYLYTKLLAKNDISVRVISGTAERDKPTEETSEEGVTVLRIPSRGFGGGTKYSLAMKLPSLFLRKDVRGLVNWADVIYMTGWFPAIPLLKKIYKKPVVVHIHSYFPFCPVGPLYNTVEEKPCELPRPVGECWRCITKYEKERKNSTMKARLSGILNSTVGKWYSEIVKIANRIIFVSKRQRDLSLRYKPSLETKSKVIPNPLPDFDFLPIEGNGLGYFGGEDVIKGPRTLIRAWQNRRETKDRKLYMARMSDEENRKNPEKNNIVFYGDLEEEALRRVYRNIRAVVVPSLCPEPSPYIVLESLLRGRIVVASRIGGITEMAGDFTGVYLFEPGNPRALQNSIDEVCSLSGEEARELGKENRKRVLRRFENKNSLQKMVGVFRDVI